MRSRFALRAFVLVAVLFSAPYRPPCSCGTPAPVPGQEHACCGPAAGDPEPAPDRPCCRAAHLAEPRNDESSVSPVDEGHCEFAGPSTLVTPAFAFTPRRSASVRRWGSPPLYLLLRVLRL